MENPIKMDDLGVPLFLETPISLEFHPVAQVFRCFGGVFKTIPLVVDFLGDHES